VRNQISNTPEALLRLIRQRWVIENEWFWACGSKLGEAAHRYTNRNMVLVFTYLRTSVMNIKRGVGYRSIRQACHELGYDIKECWYAC
jgi:hypothetical protein